ncbi:hypothetical protein MQM1_036 [Aeromonas phage vB_AsaP_MQM1]|nr:hypothetical protein MQM1_036 [Aeromonas phage vB_AsaP_MQM1]
MSKGTVQSKGGVGVCGLSWAALITTKLLGYSQLSWGFTLMWPIIFVGGIVSFCLGLGLLGLGAAWIREKTK